MLNARVQGTDPMLPTYGADFDPTQDLTVNDIQEVALSDLELYVAVFDAVIPRQASDAPIFECLKRFFIQKVLRNPTNVKALTAATKLLDDRCQALEKQNNQLTDRLQLLEDEQKGAAVYVERAKTEVTVLTADNYELKERVSLQDKDIKAKNNQLVILSREVQQEQSNLEDALDRCKRVTQAAYRMRQQLDKMTERCQQAEQQCIHATGLTQQIERELQSQRAITTKYQKDLTKAQQIIEDVKQHSQLEKNRLQAQIFEMKRTGFSQMESGQERDMNVAARTALACMRKIAQIPTGDLVPYGIKATEMADLQSVYVSISSAQTVEHLQNAVLERKRSTYNYKEVQTNDINIVDTVQVSNDIFGVKDASRYSNDELLQSFIASKNQSKANMDISIKQDNPHEGGLLQPVFEREKVEVIDRSMQTEEESDDQLFTIVPMQQRKSTIQPPRLSEQSRKSSGLHNRESAPRKDSTQAKNLQLPQVDDVPSIQSVKDLSMSKHSTQKPVAQSGVQDSSSHLTEISDGIKPLDQNSLEKQQSLEFQSFRRSETEPQVEIDGQDSESGSIKHETSNESGGQEDSEAAANELLNGEPVKKTKKHGRKKPKVNPPSSLKRKMGSSHSLTNLNADFESSPKSQKSNRKTPLTGEQVKQELAERRSRLQSRQIKEPQQKGATKVRISDMMGLRPMQPPSPQVVRAVALLENIKAASKIINVPKIEEDALKTIQELSQSKFVTVEQRTVLFEILQRNADQNKMEKASSLVNTLKRPETPKRNSLFQSQAVLGVVPEVSPLIKNPTLQTFSEGNTVMLQSQLMASDVKQIETVEESRLMLHSYQDLHLATKPKLQTLDFQDFVVKCGRIDIRQQVLRHPSGTPQMKLPTISYESMTHVYNERTYVHNEIHEKIYKFGARFADDKIVELLPPVTIRMQPTDFEPTSQLFKDSVEYYLKLEQLQPNQKPLNPVIIPQVGQDIGYVRLDFQEDVLSMVLGYIRFDLKTIQINDRIYAKLPPTIVLRSMQWIQKIIHQITKQRLSEKPQQVQLIQKKELLQPTFEARAEHFCQVPGSISFDSFIDLSQYVYQYCLTNYGAALAPLLYLQILVSLQYHAASEFKLYIFAQMFFRRLTPDFFLLYLDLLRLVNNKKDYNDDDAIKAISGLFPVMLEARQWRIYRVLQEQASAEGLRFEHVVQAMFCAYSLQKEAAVAQVQKLLVESDQDHGNIVMSTFVRIIEQQGVRLPVDSMQEFFFVFQENGRMSLNSMYVALCLIQLPRWAQFRKQSENQGLVKLKLQVKRFRDVWPIASAKCSQNVRQSVEQLLREVDADTYAQLPERAFVSLQLAVSEVVRALGAQSSGVEATVAVLEGIV